MKKGMRMEGYILIAVSVLLVLAWIAYSRSENTDYKQFADKAAEFDGSIKNLEKSHKELRDQQQQFKDDYSKMLDEILVAIKSLQQNQGVGNMHVNKNEVVHVKLAEPVKVDVNVVYRPPQNLPDAPPQITGKKSTTPLSDRAGLNRNSKKELSY